MLTGRRYGYRDYLGVAEVISNYSAANIPLETMWTDIDVSKRSWTKPQPGCLNLAEEY
jgi:alpha-glucosidase (family GH31 glycosyl hydrolase)